MAKKLLIETMPVASFQILEEATPKNGGRMKIRNIFAAMDEETGNNRVYREEIIDREVEKLKPLMSENKVFCEADHPDDGKSRISNTAALLTKLEKETVDGRKIYIGEATILNTSKGKDLQEVIRAGGKPGVSQRGWGTTLKGDWNGKEAEIVQEDYTLKTFDFVIGQATKGAEVNMVTEQMEVINLIESGPCEGCPNQQQQEIQKTTSKGGSAEMEIKSIEELRKTYPDFVQKIEEEAASKKETELKEAMKKEWEEQAKQIAEGIKKSIEESQEYKDFKAGVEAHKAVLSEIAKLVKPFISEVTEEEEEIEEQLAEAKKEAEKMKAELKLLKEQTEREKAEAAEKEKVIKKIEEVTAGKEHGKLIGERLQACKTVVEVEKNLPLEEAFIKKVLWKKEEPKGKGHIETGEEGAGELTEDQKKARKMAGITEGQAAA